ncbi:UDP-3-O-(3-hydroxymyristoyl)glucosamine N-acyltransferase [Aquifex sp.]
MLSLTFKDIAKAVDGELKGKPSEIVKGISTPENPKEDTVVFCQNDKDIEMAKEKAKLLVVNRDIEGKPYIKVKDVKLALARFLDKFFPEEHPIGISKQASIGKNVEIGVGSYIGDFVFIGNNVKIGRNVKIYPFTYVGDNTVIGDDTIIFSGVHIYKNTVIGKNVRIHSGAVIGADGFGYHITPQGIKKLNHIGNVVIEDNVEIGANTTVDRALIETTLIGKNTKIDNLVMVAHNCKVGENNILVSQVGLSGSVKTGKNVILAGQVGVADHVEIGDNVIVTAKSGVAGSLEPNKTYGANLPAIEWSKWKRIYTYLLRLPELFKNLKK